MTWVGSIWSAGLLFDRGRASALTNHRHFNFPLFVHRKSVNFSFPDGWGWRFDSCPLTVYFIVSHIFPSCFCINDLLPVWPFCLKGEIKARDAPPLLLSGTQWARYEESAWWELWCQHQDLIEDLLRRPGGLTVEGSQAQEQCVDWRLPEEDEEEEEKRGSNKKGV